MIGRANEIRELRRRFASEESEFVAIYGRRRIGKTFLVNEVVLAHEGQILVLPFRYYELTGLHPLPEFIYDSADIAVRLDTVVIRAGRVTHATPDLKA